MTKEIQRVADLCDALRQTPTLGLLLGMPGVGKSWAVQHAAAHVPEPADHRASPVIYTRYSLKSDVRGLLVNVLNCLGPDYVAPVGQMSRLVCCWIHRRMTELIIIDNADWLNKAAWHMLAEIHDRTRCAFLLVGQSGLAQKLRTPTYMLLHNRVSLELEMQQLSYDQLVRFVEQWQRQRMLSASSAVVRYSFYLDDLDTKMEALKLLYRVTMGNLRRLMQFIDQVERVTQVNSQHFVPIETFHAVAALMAGGKL